MSYSDGQTIQRVPGGLLFTLNIGPLRQSALVPDEPPPDVEATFQELLKNGLDKFFNENNEVDE